MTAHPADEVRLLELLAQDERMPLRNELIVKEVPALLDAKAAAEKRAEEAEHNLTGQARISAAISASRSDWKERAEAAERELARAREALAWYAEKAKAAQRYLAANSKGKMYDAIMALLTELSLDNGARAVLSGGTDGETGA